MAKQNPDAIFVKADTEAEHALGAAANIRSIPKRLTATRTTG